MARDSEAPGDGEHPRFERPRRITPKAIDRVPTTEACTAQDADGHTATYYREPFPGREEFAPGNVYVTQRGYDTSAEAWEYVGRTGDKPPDAIFVRYNTDGSVAKIFKAHNKILNGFKGSQLAITEIPPAPLEQ